MLTTNYTKLYVDPYLDNGIAADYMHDLQQKMFDELLKEYQAEWCSILKYGPDIRVVRMNSSDDPYLDNDTLT